MEIEQEEGMNEFATCGSDDEFSIPGSRRSSWIDTRGGSKRNSCEVDGSPNPNKGLLRDLKAELKRNEETIISLKQQNATLQQKVVLNSSRYGQVSTFFAFALKNLQNNTTEFYIPLLA